MTAHEIYIDIKPPYRGRVTKKWLREVVDITLSTQKIDRPVELSLLITGAASGIRDACALRFAWEEAQVVGFDISG